MPEWEAGQGGGNQYIKVTSEDGGNSSLISPRFTITNAQEVELILNQIGGGDLQADDLKLEISYDYTGGDISKATWSSIDLGLEAGAVYPNWTNFASKINLDPAQYAKPFVLKLKLDAKTPGQIWEINSLDIQAKDGELAAKEITDATDSSAPSDSFQASVDYNVSENLNTNFVETTTCKNSRSGKDMTVIFNKTKDKIVSFNTHNCKEKEEKTNYLMTGVFTPKNLSSATLRLAQEARFGDVNKYKAAKVYLVPSSISSLAEAKDLIAAGNAQMLDIDFSKKKFDMATSTFKESSFRLLFAYTPFKDASGKFQYFTWNIKSIQLGEK
jgi:hypothetical protein